jgi:hypothetical protein
MCLIKHDVKTWDSDGIAPHILTSRQSELSSAGGCVVVQAV